MSLLERSCSAKEPLPAGLFLSAPAAKRVHAPILAGHQYCCATLRGRNGFVTVAK